MVVIVSGQVGMTLMEKAYLCGRTEPNGDPTPHFKLDNQTIIAQGNIVLKSMPMISSMTPRVNQLGHTFVMFPFSLRSAQTKKKRISNSI